MILTFLFVGADRVSWLQDFEAEYLEKIQRYHRSEVVRLKPSRDERANSELKKKNETDLLLSRIKDSDFLVVFDERGEALGSVPFSKKMESWFNRGKSRLVFCVGGAFAEGQPLGFTLVDRGGKISATELKIEGEALPVEDRPREPRPDRGGFGGDRGGGRGPQRQLTGEKATGTVKFFNAMKGFGFVQRDDGQPDAFVHISAVERAGLRGLNEGDRLEFDIEVDQRGKFAAVNLVPTQ